MFRLKVMKTTEVKKIWYKLCVSPKKFPLQYISDTKIYPRKIQTEFKHKYFGLRNIPMWQIIKVGGDVFEMCGLMLGYGFLLNKSDVFLSLFLHCSFCRFKSLVINKQQRSTYQCQYWRLSSCLKVMLKYHF